MVLPVILGVEPILKADHLVKVVKVVVHPVDRLVRVVKVVVCPATVVKAVVHPGVVDVAVILPIVADAVVVPMVVDVVVVLPRMVDVAVAVVLLITEVVDAILRTMEGVVLQDVEDEVYSVLARRTWFMVKMSFRAKLFYLAFARKVTTETPRMIFKLWT